jgi:glyoxylase I family protein
MTENIRHVGVTVSNLENSIHYFRDLLGLQAGSVVTRQGKVIDEVLKMKNVTIRECRLTTSNNETIELIEYVHPKGKLLDLNTNNFGVTHVSFTVINIKKMYNDLTAEGYEFNNKPIVHWMNDGKGRVICYAKGPDGITVELVQDVMPGMDI